MTADVEFLDEYDPAVHVDAEVCADCDRPFYAPAHRRLDGEAHCPECEPVESIREGARRAVEQSDAPREIDVGELLQEGDAR